MQRAVRAAQLGHFALCARRAAALLLLHRAQRRPDRTSACQSTTPPLPYSPAWPSPPPLSHQAGRYAKTKKNQPQGPKATPEPSANQPRWYAADDTKRRLKSRKANRKPCKLRDSIRPGTVLILLAGRFKGRRVVFLKQLDSGLLLITGPFKVNGVPLRRVSQAYVIATSTTVDVSGVDASAINDEFFAKQTTAAAKKGSAEFFAEESAEQKKEVSQARKDAQVAVDGALLKAVKAVPHLKAYLGARFSLKKGMFPHEMVF